MGINQSSLIKKGAWIFGCALLIHCAPVLAGEPIQFSSEEQKPEKTEPQPSELPATSFSSKIFRAYRPGETVSGSDFFRSKPTMPSPRAVAPPSSSSKRDEELMDRKKNWMFLTPDDDKNAGAVEDAFGIEGNPLETRKSALDRFLEKKSFDPKNETGIFGMNKDSSLAPQMLFGAETEKQTGKQNRSAELQPNSLQPQFLEKNFVGGDSEKARMGEMWRDQFSPESLHFKEQKQAQMKDFEGLFSRGNLTGGNELGTINTGNDYGLQSTTSGGGLDSFSSSAAENYSDPFKRTPTAVLGSSTIPAPDINVRVFGASAAPPPQSLEPVKSIMQPAVLPFPKRHF